MQCICKCLRHFANLRLYLQSIANLSFLRKLLRKFALLSNALHCLGLGLQPAYAYANACLGQAYCFAKQSNISFCEANLLLQFATQCKALLCKSLLIIAKQSFALQRYYYLRYNLQCLQIIASYAHICAAHKYCAPLLSNAKHCLAKAFCFCCAVHLHLGVQIYALLRIASYAHISSKAANI